MTDHYASLHTAPLACSCLVSCPRVPVRQDEKTRRARLSGLLLPFVAAAAIAAAAREVTGDGIISARTHSPRAFSALPSAINIIICRGAYVALSCVAHIVAEAT